MLNAEKNDISINKLFEWGDKFTLVDRFGNEKLEVYIRLVGDAELNQARVYGLRKSAELRKKLKTENSEERLAFIPEKDLIEREMLIESLILFNTKELTLEALKEVHIPLPKEPSSEASLEQQEKYQAEVDEFVNKKEAGIREYVNKYLEIERRKFDTKSLEDIYKEYERALINQLCENEMITNFREKCTYFGTFKDSDYKHRLFDSFENFNTLPKEIKEQLIEDYLGLEIGGEDLKKLLAQTQ